ncbi:hypothetical protein C5167_050098 [Papaver somniferum]|uniref:Uncharacterized protein n=1 Tax=Papaver somniferum TaxID=3469 RepID=A0A4Y7KRV2_PAPSO|nr:hypothetical protein C5167_050098 [Papaver somniferum]
MSREPAFTMNEEGDGTDASKPSHQKGLRQIESPVSPEEEASTIGTLAVSLLEQGKMHLFDGIRFLGLGSFKGAVDPCTMAFQKLPSWVDDNLLPAESNGDNSRWRLTGLVKVEPSTGQERIISPQVAMYCTRGDLLLQVFSRKRALKVFFHLRSGILKYVEEIQETGSLWDVDYFESQLSMD